MKREILSFSLCSVLQWERERERARMGDSSQSQKKIEKINGSSEDGG